MEILYKGVAALSLDISAAFDRAWHPAILYQLAVLGLSPHYLKMIASFLSNRVTLLSFSGGVASKTLSLHSTRISPLALSLECLSRSLAT